LRHITPWSLLYWLDHVVPDLCWAALVCWKVMGSEWAWFMGPLCWNGPNGQEYDYCNKHKTRAEHEVALAVRNL